MEINQANKPSEFICSICTCHGRRICLLEFAIVLKLKIKKKFQWGNAAAAIELDCKTVCIFAYSSTREQSNERSGTRLKTESETGQRR